MQNTFAYIKKGLLISFFVLMFSGVALAGTNNVKRVFISESFALSDLCDENPLERFFFFFCDGLFVNSATQDVYAFFSNVVIDENVSGNFYTFFSDMTLTSASNSGMRVKTFFSRVNCAIKDGENMAEVRQIFDWMNIFKRSYISDDYLIQDDTVNPLLFNLIREAFIIGAFCIFIAIRKSFFEQGGLALKHESLRIFKSGFLIYFIFLCSIVIFLLTVFGIVVAILLFAAVLFIITLGKAALSLSVGSFVAQKINMRRGVYRELIIGALLIESIAYIPYAGLVTVFIVVPMLALGIIYVALMNMYVDKNFYEVV